MAANLVGRQRHQPFGYSCLAALSHCRGGSQTSSMPPRKNMDDARVDRLLESLWDLGATDLILTVGAPPLMRLSGELQAHNGEKALTNEDVDTMLNSILVGENRDPF